MTCFLHDRTAAVGMRVACQKAVWRECVGRDAPPIVCRAFGPAIFDGQACDPAAVDFVRQWLGERILAPHCR